MHACMHAHDKNISTWKSWEH